MKVGWVNPNYICPQQITEDIVDQALKDTGAREWVADQWRLLPAAGIPNWCMELACRWMGTVQWVMRPETTWLPSMTLTRMGSWSWWTRAWRCVPVDKVASCSRISAGTEKTDSECCTRPGMVKQQEIMRVSTSPTPLEGGWCDLAGCSINNAALCASSPFRWCLAGCGRVASAWWVCSASEVLWAFP